MVEYELVEEIKADEALGLFEDLRDSETFYDWLIAKGLYDHYDGMHTYVLEYRFNYPDMNADTVIRYSDECDKIVQQFKEDV